MKNVRFTNNVKLTNSQKEVLNYILIDGYTNKQIAKIRKTTIRAVELIRARLRVKGALNLVQNPTRTFLKGINPRPNILPEHFWRPHAYQFVVYPSQLAQKKKYQQIRKKKGNKIPFDGNTVILNKDSIEIHAGKLNWIQHIELGEALALTDAYWTKFLHKLEDYFDIIILKNRKANVRWVKRDIARVNDEIAKEITDQKEKMKIFNSETGKLRVLVDRSWNNPEMEFVEADISSDDARRYKDNVQAIVEGAPNNAQLSGHIKSLIDNQLYHDKNIRSHIKVLRENVKVVHTLGKQVKNFTQAVQNHQVKTIKIKKQTSTIKRMIPRFKQLKLLEFIDMDMDIQSKIAI